MTKRHSIPSFLFAIALISILWMAPVGALEESSTGEVAEPVEESESTAENPFTAPVVETGGNPEGEADSTETAGSLVDLPFELLQPDKVDLAGCTAEAICVHPPPATVSCSSPVNGTCIASGAGCGTVSCNGTVTRCPGYCIGDHHCARFCNVFENPNSFCNDGCCECVP